MIVGRSTYPVQRLPVVIPIGIQTETGVDEIGFDVSAWTKKWPDIEVEVWHRLPGQAEAYLTKSRREGDIVYWQVTDTDTQIPGTGRVELMGILPDGRKLSGSTDTRIRETICARTKDPPDAPPTWVDTVREMIGEGGGVVLTIDDKGNATHLNDHPLADTAAREAAATAQEAAEGAASAANKAQSTANTAKTTAEKALTDANSNHAGLSLTPTNITGNTLFRATYGGGLWVGKGSNGLWYSEDGETWTQSNITTSISSGVVYADGVFLAGATGTIYYSADGKIWASATGDTNGYFIRKGTWAAFAYGNGVWVAVSSAFASRLYSTDGKNWITSKTSTNTYNVVYGNGLWVAGSANTDKLSYSEDGVTWASGDSPRMKCKYITYGDSLWVAGSYDTRLGLYYSEDGKNWTQSNITDNDIDGIVYGNGVWLAHGNFEKLYYSADGRTWVQNTAMDGVDIRDIAYGDGLWVAGSAGTVYYSENGQTWTKNSGSVEGAYWNSVAYGGGKWTLGGSVGVYDCAPRRKYATPGDLANAVANIGDNLILKSTTEGSTKRFRLTVDDTGTIKAEEVTA